MKKNFIYSKNKIKINLIIFFIIICNTSFNKELLIKSQKPKVSVFLPIFNKELYLIRSITSIQKQTLKNIEIVVVNDCSTDNSLKILKKLSKKDNRIKIINNDRNHGLLYSRAMGILNCTGDFIMNLDPDDQFISENNLKFLYKKSQKYNSDLIEFLLKKLVVHNISSLCYYIKLIWIKNIYYKWTNKIDILITNKFIKKDIIIKAFNFFKDKIYSNKWNYHEDHIWHFLINKYAKSKIIFYKYIYLYIINKDSLMNNRKNILELKNFIYKNEMLEKIYNQTNLDDLLYLLNMVNLFFNNTYIIDTEIKNKIVRICYNYINYFKIKGKNVTFL